MARGFLDHQQNTQKRERCEPCKSTTTEELMKLKALFTAWLVHAYIEEFSESIATMITEKNWEPSKWLEMKQNNELKTTEQSFDQER